PDEGSKRVLIATLYERFSFAIRSNRARLIAQMNDVAELAWRARNLLELRIWVEYCALSEEKAWRFYTDGVRDMADLNKRKAGGYNNEEQVQKAIKLAAIEGKAHGYTDIRDAVAELNLNDYYGERSKSLHKYVHPTALSVTMPFRQEAQEDLGFLFIKAGLQYGNRGLEILNGSLMAHLYARYANCMDKMREQMSGRTAN